MLRRIDPRECPTIHGAIDADEVYAGRGVVVEAGAVIRAKRVLLGDYCYVGAGVRVFAEEFRLGDYTKWHEHGLGSGDGVLQIGRNGWIGRDVVLDGKGGLTIDDGVGIGHGSQLYTHVQFGDVLWVRDGLYQRWPLRVGHDVWLVGHVLVGGARVIGPWSMALAGSAVTRDVPPGHVYGGSPAVDVTEKVPPQLDEWRTVDRRAAMLGAMLARFADDEPLLKGVLRVASGADAIAGATNFDVEARTYTQTHSPAEVAFLRAHTPLVKFTPDGAPPFVDTPIEELVSNE